MDFKVGDIVRAWDGDRYRVGRYLGTVERGRHFGKRRVEFRHVVHNAETGETSWVWREQKVQPDSVHRAKTEESRSSTRAKGDVQVVGESVSRADSVT